MSPFRVHVVADDTVIGIADLGPCDPAMGVAFGRFHPNAAYDVRRHARASEDVEHDAPPTRLSARERTGRVLACAGCDLVDFSRTYGEEEREFYCLGMDAFDRYFGSGTR